MNTLNNMYCRLCAEQKSSDNLLDLRTNSVKCEEIAQRLAYLNAKSVDILEESFLPKTVCFLCRDSLNEAYDFLNRVREAQIVLTNIFDIKPEDNDVNFSDDEKHSVTFEEFSPTSPAEPNQDVDKVKHEVSQDIFKPQEFEDIHVQLDIPNVSVTVKTEPKEEVDSNKELELVEDGSLDLNVQDLLNATLCKIQPTKSSVQVYGKEIDATIDRSWKNYRWLCRHCFMEFPDLFVLRLHSKELHGDCFGYLCIDCDTDKDTFDEFVDHVRMHRKYLKHRCPHCDALMKRGKSKSHLAQHFNKSHVACRACGEILKNQDALEKHVLLYATRKKTKKPRRKRGAPVTVKDLTCQTCDKVYKNRNSLRDHQKLHVKDRSRNYTCDRCGKAFFNKGTLTSHIMAHDMIRPHVCKICNKSFLYPNMLRRHVQMHSGVKPFSCEQCGRCFRLKYQLNAHKIIHTDRMPYECQYCRKLFRFKQILKNHERQHTGAKPYACDLCRIEFTNWSNYNKHMKRRHNTDKSRKKITPVGIFPVNPETGQIVEIVDPVATEEWKTKIMIPVKRGKKKKVNDEDANS